MPHTQVQWSRNRCFHVKKSPNWRFVCRIFILTIFSRKWIFFYNYNWIILTILFFYITVVSRKIAHLGRTSQKKEELNVTNLQEFQLPWKCFQGFDHLMCCYNQTVGRYEMDRHVWYIVRNIPFPILSIQSANLIWKADQVQDFWFEGFFLVFLQTWSDETFPRLASLVFLSILKKNVNLWAEWYGFFSTDSILPWEFSLVVTSSILGTFLMSNGLIQSDRVYLWSAFSKWGSETCNPEMR